MKKKEFQNLPSTETPITAENLNEMQDGIEESCVVVSPTEPTTNEKVWIQKGKNRFNKDKVVSGKRLIDGTNGLYDSATSATSEYIKILPNTSYYISNYNAYHVYDKDGNIVQSKFSSSTISETISTLENAYSMRISVLIADLDIVQLEQGSTATEYEAYVEKAIYTKNDNDVFEPFYKESEVDEKINNSIKTKTSLVPANSQTTTINIPGLKTLINVYCNEDTISTYPNREIVGFKQSGENVIVTQAGTLQYDNYIKIVYI